MTMRIVFCVLTLAVLCSCGRIPYRTDGLASKPDCARLYEANEDISYGSKTATPAVVDDPCWKRSIEERSNYDLLFMEFDDQGWVQESKGDPEKSQDYFDKFFAKLGQIYDANRSNGLSIVVFVHGWHHNADARDNNVTEFRRLLRDLAAAEVEIHKSDDVKNRMSDKPRRMVGIYLGWRGESITLPWVTEVTFWDRKNTAERVAQGSILEFFSRMDLIRDRSRSNLNFDGRTCAQSGEGRRNVRMLTIAHSFGGLITYEALGGELVRIATRSRPDDYVSRLGDLVIIANPALEGTRFEPLRLAGQRLKSFRENQLPVVVLATSRADWATRKVFPTARWFNTIFENTPGEEGDALVKTVGHNPRYITHTLDVCPKDDARCTAACQREETKERGKEKINEIKDDIAHERDLMGKIAHNGFEKNQYLCGGMLLAGTDKWLPRGNPFWVVYTSGDVMKGHNDIFNPNFVSFMRQMYLGVIETRNKPEMMGLHTCQ